MDTIDRLGILANTCTVAADALTRRREERDQLNALCLRYGGPHSSDWDELLDYIEGALEFRRRAEAI